VRQAMNDQDVVVSGIVLMVWCLMETYRLYIGYTANLQERVRG